MNTTQIGNMYEIYILNLLKANYDNIWLTKEIPNNIVKECNFPNCIDIITCDFGFDILAIKGNTRYFIQCKNFTESSVCINSLAGFFHFVLSYPQLSDNKFIVYYNGKLSHKINKNGIIDYINIYFDNNTIPELNSTIPLIPRCYQLDAYKKLKNNSTSILSMPCGMGKTYTSYLMAQDYDNILIISPLKEQAKQMYKVYKKFCKGNYKVFLISTDGDRCKPNLGNKNIISTTFDSCNIINTFIKKLDNLYIIVDEYHNLSSNDIAGKTELGKILNENGDVNKLFISATPKNFDSNILNNAVKYEYTWSDAISNGYLSDYKVYYGLVKNTLPEEQPLNIDMMFSDYLKAYNILYGLNQNGHKKCIVYVNSVNECTNFVKTLEFVNQYTKLNINVGIINSSISKKNRNKTLFAFLDDTKTQIICNVNILNEGIDIPECDSVYIITDSLNAIKIIQRSCRCNRKNKDKVAGIYIWSNKMNSIKNIIETTFGNKDKIMKMKYSVPENYIAAAKDNLNALEIENIAEQEEKLSDNKSKKEKEKEKDIRLAKIKALKEVELIGSIEAVAIKSKIDTGTATLSEITSYEKYNYGLVWKMYDEHSDNKLVKFDDHFFDIFYGKTDTLLNLRRFFSNNKDTKCKHIISLLVSLGFVKINGNIVTHNEMNNNINKTITTHEIFNSDESCKIFSKGKYNLTQVKIKFIKDKLGGEFIRYINLNILSEYGLVIKVIRRGTTLNQKKINSNSYKLTSINNIGEYL